MTRFEELKMLLAVAAGFLAAVLVSELAYGRTAVVTVDPAPAEGERVCVVAATAPDIAGRWASGELTTLHGQCTTETGQTVVNVGNIAAGQVWYFSGFAEDVMSNRSSFFPEVVVDVPVASAEVVPLPLIEVSGKTFSIQVVVE